MTGTIDPRGSDVDASGPEFAPKALISPPKALISVAGTIGPIRRCDGDFPSRSDGPWTRLTMNPGSVSIGIHVSEQLSRGRDSARRGH